MSIIHIGEQETFHYMMPSRRVWVSTLESMFPLMPVTISSSLWMSGAWILHPSTLWDQMRVRYFYRVGFVTSWVEYSGWYGTHLLGTESLFFFFFAGKALQAYQFTQCDSPQWSHKEELRVASCLRMHGDAYTFTRWDQGVGMRTQSGKAIKLTDNDGTKSSSS